MKGKTTYQFKKILFQSSRIDIAGGWHVGNKADNPACRYPKRGTDRDLIYNHSAITLENLMSGKLKAALLNMEDGTQILYFQYQSSTNGQIQAVVMPEHPMRIEVDRDVDDHYASYLAVQFMSACYFLISPDASPYGSIREGLKDVQDMARQICGAKTDTPDDMARISDIMYYGIAKAGDPESTIAFSMTFAEQAAQMMRSASSIETPDLSEEIEGLAETKQSEKKNKSSNELLSCTLDEFSRKVKDGRLLIGYSWNEAQKQMIPDIDSIWDSYECSESERRMIVRVFMSLQEKLAMIRKSITFDEIMDSSATVENLLLMGPPGCGKTYGVAAMCAALGLPLGVHVCQSNMEESHVEGDAKIINGAIQTVPSKVGELYAIGGCIDLEEINLAEPGILQGVIGQALEYPYIFKYNGYYEMRRHPLTVFVGTMNPEAEGTRSLNEALANRFSHTMIVEPAPRAEMANILSSGGFKKRDCMKVIRIYEKIMKYLEKYDPALTPRISMRACRECLVNLRCGFDWAQAVEESFIGQIYAASPAVAGDIRSAQRPLHA